MSKQLNDEFRLMASGNFGFLTNHPLQIDPQYFGVLPGDAAAKDPLKKVPVQLALKGQGVDLEKDKVLGNKTVTMYADFNMRPEERMKQVVSPTMHLVGAHESVKLFYLPWKENKRHTMVIDESADFFMTASMHGCRFEVKSFGGGGQLSVSHTNVQGKGAQEAIHKLAKADGSAAPTVLSFGKDVYFEDAIKCMAAAKHNLMPMGIAPHQVKTANPENYTANVVGVRGAAGWRFYYQLSGMLDVDLLGETTKQKWLGLYSKKLTVTKGIQLDIVLKVAEIWPDTRTIYEI